MKEFNLETPLGHCLSVSVFEPKEQAKAALMICSATGVKQSLYYKFAQFLSTQGYIVYTFDYAGIDLSKPDSLKRFNTSASDWANNDIESVLKMIKAKHSDIPLLALGHSIGGQLLGITPSNNQLDGIILVAAQMGYWKMWSGVQKYSMAFLWYVLMPISIKLNGYFPGKLLGSSEDLPKDMAMEWNSWCRSPNYLFDRVDGADEMYNKVCVPLYSISAEDDKLAPQNVVDWISQRYQNAVVTRIHLTPKELNLKSIGHFGYFRSNKKVVWHQLMDVIKKLS
jgi:predicted alpha/beta hydrolase